MTAKPKSTNKLPYFSIIIVVRNDRGILSSLKALDKYVAKKSDCEVIVVDASTNGALDDIAKQFSWVHWMPFVNTTGKRFTIPEQRNLGTKKARGEVIIFLDANCVPEKGWFETFETAFLKENHDAVTGPIRSVGENKVHDAGYEIFADDQEMTECGAANLGIRKSVLQELHGFDEEMSYGEDVDLTWRVCDAGYKILFKKNAEIAHDWGKFREELRRALRYGTARTALYKKHPKQLRRIIGPDINVLVYPSFIILLPVTIWFPYYPLLILIPLLKNFGSHAFSRTTLHLVYAAGIIRGIFKTV